MLVKLFIHKESPWAFLVSLDGDPATSTWLPHSAIIQMSPMDDETVKAELSEVTLRKYLMSNRNAHRPRLVLGGKCVNGHVITEDNLYTYFDGRTVCRDCSTPRRAAAHIVSRLGRPRMYDQPEGDQPPKKTVNLQKLRFMGEITDG